MGTRRQRKWAVAVASCGNLLEWYDFSLYGFFAPVLAGLFFPAENRIASLLAAFGVFAIGFAMRLVGGAVLGSFSDRYGRAATLRLSVILMAVPTTLIGLLPTYAQIGLAAPLLLTVLRMIQGLSVGGEYATSIVLLLEHADRSKRGSTGSWAPVAATAGCVLGAGTGTLVTACLTAEQLAAWGWRVPFVFGSVVGLIASVARRGLTDPPEFARLKASGAAPPSFGRLLGEHRRAILRIASGACLNMVGFYVFFVYLSTHLATQTGMTLSVSMRTCTVGLTALAVLLPLAGRLADRLGRRRVSLAGCWIAGVSAPALFWLFDWGDDAWDTAGVIFFAAAFALVNATGSIVLAETVPTRVRGSVFSVAFNLSAAVFGGFAPLASAALIGLCGTPVSPGFLVTAAAVISGIGFWFSKGPEPAVGWQGVFPEGAGSACASSA